MGPVRQNPIQGTVRSVVLCIALVELHTILHRTDLIISPLTLQTITVAPMMSTWGKGVALWSTAHLKGLSQLVRPSSSETAGVRVLIVVVRILLTGRSAAGDRSLRATTALWLVAALFARCRHDVLHTTQTTVSKQTADNDNSDKKYTTH